MTTTQNTKSNQILPSAFWLYLLGVHLAYALLLSLQFDWLVDSSLSFQALSFPEMSVLGDLVIVPALLYAILARKRPMQALIGGAKSVHKPLSWYPRPDLLEPI